MPVIDKLLELLQRVINRVTRDTRFLKTILLFFILLGLAIFVIIYLSYMKVLDQGLHGTLLGVGISMFTTSVISYLFQIRKNNTRITTLTDMAGQLQDVEQVHDDDSAKMVNDIYKTVFSKMITDNLN